MKLIFILIFFLSFLSFINSLYIYFDSKERKCLSIYVGYNSTLNIVYYVSGQEEEQNIASIEDEKGNILTKTYNKKNSKFSYKTKNGDYLNFCFENLASTKVTLSFEFDFGILDFEVISIRTIENFVKVVDNLEKKLKQLQFNIRNSAVRKRAHFKVANDIRKKINLYALVKICFLIIFSVFQLMMITSIFKNVKVVSQININSERKPLKSGNKKETPDFL